VQAVHGELGTRARKRTESDHGSSGEPGWEEGRTDGAGGGRAEIGRKMYKSL